MGTIKKKSSLGQRTPVKCNGFDPNQERPLRPEMVNSWKVQRCLGADALKPIHDVQNILYTILKKIHPINQTGQSRNA